MSDNANVALAPSILALKPEWTMGAGIILSPLLGWVGAEILTSLISWLFEPAAWANIFSFWFLFCVLTGIILQTGFGHTVTLGDVAILTLFNGPVTWFVLLTGDHWLLPGLGKIYVTVWEQAGPEKSLQVPSKDGILMDAGYMFVYSVFDPFLFIRASNPLNILGEIADGKFRDNFAAQDEDVLRTAEERSHISARMTASIQQEARALGIKLKVVVTKATSPKEILEANARKAVEKAQAESERTEADGIRARIAAYTNDGKNGMSEAKAIEVDQAERGKVVTTRNITKFEGIEPAIDALAPLVKMVVDAFAKKGDAK